MWQVEVATVYTVVDEYLRPMPIYVQQRLMFCMEQIGR